MDFIDDFFQVINFMKHEDFHGDCSYLAGKYQIYYQHQSQALISRTKTNTSGSCPHDLMETPRKEVGQLLYI
jgi:hypothetical protein